MHKCIKLYEIKNHWGMLEQLDGSISVSIAFDSQPIETSSLPSNCSLEQLDLHNKSSKVCINCNLAAMRPGHWADNCKMVNCTICLNCSCSKKRRAFISYRNYLQIAVSILLTFSWTRSWNSFSYNSQSFCYSSVWVELHVNKMNWFCKWVYEYHIVEQWLMVWRHTHIIAVMYTT